MQALCYASMTERTLRSMIRAYHGHDSLSELPCHLFLVPPSRFAPKMVSPQSAATPTATAAQILEDVNKHTAAYQGGDQRAREAALSSAFKLISELETPSETIVRMLWCWVSGHSIPAFSMLLILQCQPTQLAVVRTAVELDLFQHLASGDGSPKTSGQLAKATACDPIIMCLSNTHSKRTVRWCDMTDREFSASANFEEPCSDRLRSGDQSGYVYLDEDV